MSAANYEFCPMCDQKALYVGEEDMPDDLVVLHKACQELALAEAVAAEQAKITRVLEARRPSSTPRTAFCPALRATALSLGTQ